MEDIRKERLVIIITTLAGLSCILQNHFGDWEFWVPWVVFAAGVVLWWVHLTEKINSMTRMWLYFFYAAFMLFYHGIHDTSLFDLSVSAALFIATFNIVDRVVMLNMILIEYAVVMLIQFYFLYINDQIDMSAFDTMRIVYHMGTVLVMYVFSRITVSNRNTERERIEKWQESVLKNDSDMEDFLSNVSHELRTPVNVISGMTTLMQKNNDSHELTSIKEAGIRLAHQIEDIQDYTEIKREELVLEEENYMCVSLINDVVANYNSIYKDSKLELIIDLAPETPSVLYGDIRKLHKLFRHLIDNAVKFTRKGGINLKIFTEHHEHGVNLTIEITDTGIGMTRADMARVSKGMYQANKKRNRSTGGIGIGLPIVYGFVHKMGGFVMINSEKKKGTTVRLTIPQKVVDMSPCLMTNDNVKDGLVFYSRLDKFKVPEVRDFYKNMVINLATGLKTRLYSASDRKELEHLLEEMDVSHIFMGVEEYEAEADWIEQLSRDGYKIVVSADAGFKVSDGSRVLVMQKPLYAFPVVRILNGEEDNNINSNQEEKIYFPGVSALVVDDEPMNLVVASGLFRDYKMIVDSAESGKEAIRKYESGSYDIIFMDHMMPEMDGVETMKQIRQIALSDGRTPIIVALTANALSGAKEMFIKEGFDGFIAKPIDIIEFERVMKRVLPETAKFVNGGEN